MLGKSVFFVERQRNLEGHEMVDRSRVLESQLTFKSLCKRTEMLPKSQESCEITISRKSILSSTHSHLCCKMINCIKANVDA